VLQIEYTLVKFDDQEKTVKLDLRGLEIVEALIKEEEKGYFFRSLPSHRATFRLTFDGMGIGSPS